MTPATQHIGIIACSAEGAALCYRTICAEAPATLGPHAHPEISLHSQSLSRYVAALDRGDLAGVGELMLDSAGRLASAGADFLISPDNTIHAALPPIEGRMPLPFLSIADVVAGEAERRGFRKIGLTGTAWLTDSDVYPRALSPREIEMMRPTGAERDEIDRVIMEELVPGVVRPEAVATFQRVFTRMKAAGCEAAILGCTEIPLIMHEGKSPLPVLDSTRLLARAALARAIARHDGGGVDKGSQTAS